jgi:hypothetical protein
MKIVHDQYSDLFMMIFYYLRKISIIVDDFMLNKHKSTSLSPKRELKIASPKLVSIKFYSPELKPRKVMNNDKVVNLFPVLDRVRTLSTIEEPTLRLDNKFDRLSIRNQSTVDYSQNKQDLNLFSGYMLKFTKDQK